MILRKCSKCKTYTLKENCPKCSKKTELIGYKFIKIRNAPPRSTPFKKR